MRKSTTAMTMTLLRWSVESEWVGSWVSEERLPVKSTSIWKVFDDKGFLLLLLIIMKMPVNQSQNSQWPSQKIYIIILKICIVVIFVSQFFADPFLCLTLVQGYHQLNSLNGLWLTFSFHICYHLKIIYKSPLLGIVSKFQQLLLSMKAILTPGYSFT